MFTFTAYCISIPFVTVPSSVRNANVFIDNFDRIAVCISGPIITFHGSVRTANTLLKNCHSMKLLTYSGNESQVQEFYEQHEFSVAARHMYGHYGETDFIMIFLSREKYMLWVPHKMYGLSTFGVLYMRSISVLLYAYMVCIEYISYYLKVKLLRHRLHCLKDVSTGVIIRKARLHIATFRHTAVWHIAVIILILLLLCGDIHPNPGPVLPGSIRHPLLQLLVVGAWNVRTLLETKRTHIRPTAIVARELDRYGIDIAALGETRVLGESVIEERGGGYTFFLKGKPVGDKRHHGVGIAIRTRLLKHLEGKFPVGINERLMTMSFPLEGNTLSIISAYAPTLPPERRDQGQLL